MKHAAGSHKTREVLQRCCLMHNRLYNREVKIMWSYTAIAALYLHVAMRT